MWYYQNEPFLNPPENINAFVYIIHNLQTGKKYIGMKTIRGLRTRTIKGKKVRKMVDTEWQNYYSSSKEIQEQVATLGTENFRREILYLCQTKSEAKYLEAMEQFKNDVLRSDDFINGIIQCRINRKHLPKKIS